jgi:hypothetical protein
MPGRAGQFVDGVHLFKEKSPPGDRRYIAFLLQLIETEMAMRMTMMMMMTTMMVDG